MAKYIVEFKQADSSGYTHTKRTFDDLNRAKLSAEEALAGGNEIEYLIIRRVKDKVVTVKIKETAK